MVRMKRQNKQLKVYRSIGKVDSLKDIVLKFIKMQDKSKGFTRSTSLLNYLTSSPAKEPSCNVKLDKQQCSS